MERNRNEIEIKSNLSIVLFFFLMFSFLDCQLNRLDQNWKLFVSEEGLNSDHLMIVIVIAGRIRISVIARITPSSRQINKYNFK